MCPRLGQGTTAGKEKPMCPRLGQGTTAGKWTPRMAPQILTRKCDLTAQFLGSTMGSASI